MVVVMGPILGAWSRAIDRGTGEPMMLMSVFLADMKLWVWEGRGRGLGPMPVVCLLEPVTAWVGS